MSNKNYATGCAFNLDEMLMNFPYDKINLTCEDCQRINGDPHKLYLIKKIFRECFKLIINDIIDNNATFWLPLTGNKKCCIKMKRVRGEAFKNLRRGGKWSDVDFLNSYFTGYEIGFYMYGVRSPRIKTVYLNKEYKNRITTNTNKGMQYGDSNNDKNINDYLEIVYSKFPDISQSDLKRICVFCFKSLYLCNSYGGDIHFKDNEIWCYIGFLKKDSIKHFLYYIKKLTVKLRVLYKRKKIKWDGYYYFALSQKQYDQFIGTPNKRGRPKTKFTFKNIMLYQILDECKIDNFNKQYIFKIPYLTWIKTKFLVPEVTTDKAELIIKRNPMKFKDILITDNEYDVL